MVIMLMLMQLLISLQIYSQQKPIALTADSLVSGSYKDVFKSFFQLAFSKFTSDNKELEFSSNPFAVMTRTNPRLLIDTSYVRYKHLRNLNFTFSVKLDSVYKFNGFSSGVKYAIINNRDETVSLEFVKQVYTANKEWISLFNEAVKHISEWSSNDVEKAGRFATQLSEVFVRDAKFSSMDEELRNKVIELAREINADNFLAIVKADPDVNVRGVTMKTYMELRDQFQQGWLWTVGISDTTYRDQFFFSNIVLTSDVIKGITQPNKPHAFELNLKSALQFNDDSLHTGRDLKRLFFNIEPGINLVLKTAQTQYPWLEFKLSGSYIHGFNSLYENERRDSLTLNGTLRFKIFGDVWIPLAIKYDPKSGNVFGFLDVRANFTALKKIFGPKNDDLNN